MQTIEHPPEFSHDRRRFLGVATLSLAAMQLGPIGPAKAQGGPAKPARPAAIKPGTNTSFAALKQIDAGPLNVGYAEAGPADGPPVLLLHGWPYDIHSYVDVAPILAAAGYGLRRLGRQFGVTLFLVDFCSANRTNGVRRRWRSSGSPFERCPESSPSCPIKSKRGGVII